MSNGTDDFRPSDLGGKPLGPGAHEGNLGAAVIAGSTLYVAHREARLRRQEAVARHADRAGAVESTER